MPQTQKNNETISIVKNKLIAHHQIHTQNPNMQSKGIPSSATQLEC